MKASELAKKIIDLIILNGNDLDVYYSPLVGDGKEVQVNSIGYNYKQIILSNEEDN